MRYEDWCDFREQEQIKREMERLSEQISALDIKKNALRKRLLALQYPGTAKEKE